MSVFTSLASGFPLEEVPTPPGLEIFLEPGKREAEYRNAGRGFAVFASDRFPELQTEKEYCFDLDIYGGEEALAAYLREQLEEAGEIEIWHVWLDGEAGRLLLPADKIALWPGRRRPGPSLGIHPKIQKKFYEKKRNSA